MRKSVARAAAPSASASMQARLRYIMPLSTSLLEPNRPINRSVEQPRSYVGASAFANVRLWHIADIDAHVSNVCFEG